MSDVAPAPVAAPAAPVANGKAPEAKAAPSKPIATKAPEAKAPEVDDSEEYVVDGKPVRLTKSQRQLHFQKALAADKRLKEAADQRNKLADDEKLFETNPEEYYRKKGKDPDKVFADYLAKKAKLELMSPEQRAAEQMARERDEYKAKVEASEKKEAEAKQVALDRQNGERIERGLVAAADKHGLDERPETLESLLNIAEEFVSNGITITYEQVVEEHVRREREHIEQRDKRLLGVLSGKKLLDYLGKEGLEKVKAAMAEADAASLSEIPKPQARPKTQVRAHERATKGYLRESDFDKQFLK